MEGDDLVDTCKIGRKAKVVVTSRLSTISEARDLSQRNIFFGKEDSSDMCRHGIDEDGLHYAKTSGCY